MSTPVGIKQRPIHPMRVGIPIGLWVFSMAANLVYAFGPAGAGCTSALAPSDAFAEWPPR
jgi:uncharacterized membrane protein